MKPTPWTLDDAIAMARALESLATFYGYSVALGGQALIAGSTNGALELFFYPRDTAEGVVQRSALLGKLLFEWQWSPPTRKPWQVGYDDDKVIYTTTTDRQQMVNLIFVR